ncbi:MAG: NfeD family protein [Acidimicrobiales bacterium]
MAVALAVALALVGSLVGSLTTAATAQAASIATAGSPPTVPPITAPSQAVVTGNIDVVQITSLIDPVEVNFLRHAVKGAAESGSLALVLQLDSGGGVVSSSVLASLTSTIAGSKVPVAVWVGPNGSHALGQAYAIFQAAALRGMAPGTRVGDAVVPGPLQGRTVNDTDAAARQITTPHLNQATFGDFVVNLDGIQVGGETLHTAKVVHLNGEPRRQPTVSVVFEKLSLVEQLLHTAASPSVAYLMLLIGLLLIALDFFTGGVGIGTACGCAALVLASYGLGTLPIRVWALVLLVVAVFGFCVDLQSGVPRVWTGLGALCLAVGSLFLYRQVQISWLAFIVGVLGTPLYMVVGLPSLVRSRFSTPTIGRKDLVGEMGVALSAVHPEGTVEVRGAPWRARTNRATPIAGGDPIRVVAIDGLLLEVEPETGGARDAHH